MRRLLVVVLVTATLRAAWAYDPATTHAGLTERSVMASRLHRVLSRQLGRPLGLFEPLALRAADMETTEARYLLGRLAALDPAGGYRPGDDGAAPAMAWVVAGAVIASTPAERAQNLFYDPSRGSGLSEAGGLVQVGHALRLLMDSGGSFRAIATGTSFNLTGLPATKWLESPDNDVGLTAFYAALETAGSAQAPGQRATALARALLALGGTLAVLQDAGEPAHVRNDFRGAYLASAGEGPFDRGSAFERFVADSYGRGGIPDAAGAVSRPQVMAFITGADAQGLADRTQRRFFSDGTVPEDAVVEPESSSADVVRDARATLVYGLPGVPRLDLRKLGERRYVYALGESAQGRLQLTSYPPPPKAGARRGPRRVLGYQRVPGRVRFFLDDAVYADTARALLPEIGAYGAGLIDHLFRAEIRLEVSDGKVGAHVEGARGALRGGTLRLYADDARGRRSLIGQLAPGALSGAAIALPAEATRIAAVLRAEDDAGVLVAVAEQPAR
jgi:hypothetical protein